ncbi:MAG: DUF262 domain-containing HNH endonuclease family protein [Verrucomicrobiae bacterium]|nr:DUF262 domain-containing HNH endonuclease family protein [Verrucomicrobiae bacterium]
MLNPVITRIETILSGSSVFAIPVYQREYKWGKEEALELIEDLRSYMGAKDENLFLGNLICEKAKDQRAYVVDGQQRLTTIFLLLIACRMRARQLRLEKLEPRIQDKITFIDSTTGESSGPRLVASESVREVFEHMANLGWDGRFPHQIGKKPVKRKVNKIKPIYDFFEKEIAGLDASQLSKFLRAIYDSYVAKFEVENEVEALSIFERTNARGLDLEISDLLKNFLFSKKVKDIESLWDQILDNSGGTILRMLKYFYVSKNGYVRKPELYNKLKSYGDDVTPQQLTQQLADFSNFYALVKAPTKDGTKTYFEAEGFSQISSDQYRYERIHRALEALREFNVVQFCPPAFAAIECIARNRAKKKPGEAKKLIQLFETFEKYHFINNVICERVGNEVEQLYAQSCVSFAGSRNFIQIADQLIKELRHKLAKEDEFIANFSDLSYATDPVSTLGYIFDRLNNAGLDPGQCVQIFNPDPKLHRRNYNIEHFLPQKPSSGVKNEDLNAVDNIGNLLVIYFKDNSSLGNAMPAEKIKRLKSDLLRNVQNMKYVTDFIAEYGSSAESWDADNISKRARSMALKAYREVWKIA